MNGPTDSPRKGRWQVALRTWAIGLLAVLALAAAPAWAEEDTAAAKAEKEQSTLEELEEKLRILAEEIADMRTETAVPDDVQPTDGFSGLGPGASKVYRRDRGLSIGGYGDVRFRAFTNDADDQTNIFDALRFVLYTGYKFNDWLVMNSELELEHGSTSGSGSASLEFLTIDFLLKEQFNIRSGLLLIPMGFINEVHEPPFYYGAERPEVERRIIPSTWRENGVGGFGTFDFDEVGDLHWRMYGVNGMDATGFADNGLRGGRQKGSEALADHWGFVARMDYEAGSWAPGLLVGGSVYYGKSGQNQSNTVCIDFCSFDPGDPVLEPLNESRSVPDTPTTIYEVHVQYRGYGVSFRALWAQAFIDNAGALSRALDTASNRSIARNMIGGYAEIGYNVLGFVNTNMSLEPFFRYEYLDTQHDVNSNFTKNNNRDFSLYVYGLQYKPIPQVVVKLDYRDFDVNQGKRADEVQASIGFVF